MLSRGAIHAATALKQRVPPRVVARTFATVSPKSGPDSDTRYQNFSFAKDTTVPSQNLHRNIEVFGETGEQRYLKSISGYTTRSIGLASAMGFAGYHIGMHLTSDLNMLAFGGAFGASMYAIVKMNSIPVPVKDDSWHPPEAVVPKEKLRAFDLFSLSMGVVALPAVFIYPHAVPHAAMAALAVTGGSVFGATVIPPNKALSLGVPLFGGLCGLLVINLSNIFIQSPLLHDVNLYGGVGLFTLYSIFDYHEALQRYRDGQLDPIYSATNFSLNIINLFVRFVQIFGRKSYD